MPRNEHRAPLTPISTVTTVETKKVQPLMAERPAEQQLDRVDRADPNSFAA